MQDLNINETYTMKYKSYLVKVDDILKIEVNSENPETAIAFNPGALSNNISPTKEGLLYNGYIVNSDGDIYLPYIGKIKVQDMSIEQIRNYIYNNIKDKDYLKNPSVDVKLINAHFTVLGEVTRPGTYDYIKNNMNLLEAIGVAGDLTINGKRNDIKIIRENNEGIKSISSIDLTSSNFLKSALYFFHKQRNYLRKQYI